MLEVTASFDTNLWSNWLAEDQLDLHNKNNKILVKTSSRLDSLSFKDQVTENTAVKLNNGIPFLFFVC